MHIPNLALKWVLLLLQAEEPFSGTVQNQFSECTITQSALEKTWTICFHLMTAILSVLRKPARRQETVTQQQASRFC